MIRTIPVINNTGGVGKRKEVIVRTETDGPSPALRTLNEAREEGWRIAQIGLRPPPAGPSRVVVTIERDAPPSLFDFSGDAW